MSPHILHEAAKEITRLQEVEKTLLRLRGQEHEELRALRKENTHLKQMIYGMATKDKHED